MQAERGRAREEPLSDSAPAIDANNVQSVEQHVRFQEIRLELIEKTHQRICQLRDRMKVQLQLANSYDNSSEFADLPDIFSRDSSREQKYLKILRLAVEEIRTAADALKLAKDREKWYWVFTNYPPFVLPCP